MYHAKRAGRNCHVFYAPEMNAAAVERLLLKSKLRRALERDEFVVRYQPKVDLASGDVVGRARRCCAGACPVTATSRRRSSSRWPRNHG